MYSPERGPLGNWASRVISNQISNLIESNYGNFTKPCFRCEAAIGDNGCSIYGQQGRKCVLFEKWLRVKGNALATKLPLALEDHSQEVYDLPDNGGDLEPRIALFHQVLLPLLTPEEQKIYTWVYIEDREEPEVRELMAAHKVIDKEIPWQGKLKIIKVNIMAKAKLAMKDADL